MAEQPNNNLNKRKNDVQFGKLIQKVDDLEQAFYHFKDDMTIELRNMSTSASKRWDTLNSHFGNIGNKVDREDCIQNKAVLDKKIHAHAIYWKVALGILVFILGILKLVDVFVK